MVYAIFNILCTTMSIREKYKVFYKDYAFREFSPYPDPFLEWQSFMNLAVHFIRTRSNLNCSSIPFYIMLLVGVVGGEENCG